MNLCVSIDTRPLMLIDLGVTVVLQHFSCCSQMLPYPLYVNLKHPVVSVCPILSVLLEQHAAD